MSVTFSRRKDTQPDNLVKTLMGYYQLRAGPGMKWGNDHEPAGRRAYLSQLDKAIDEVLFLREEPERET